MPVQIKSVDGGAGLEFINTGVVTGADIIEANKTAYTRENTQRLKYKLIDRTHCTEYLVTSEEVQIIANQDKEASKINPNIIILLTYASDLQYGLTRMWEAYVSESGLTMKFFEDRKSTDIWIKENIK